MSMTFWPKLDDLIWLFESDPVFEFEDLRYPDAATTFTTIRGATEVECTVEPYMNSISIRLSEGGDERLRLHLWGLVDGLALDRTHDCEALVATMKEGAGFLALRLELKPSPRFSWSSKFPWAPEARI
jgi:hypothetical protein